MLSSSLAVQMTLLVRTLHFLGFLAICSLLSWSLAVLVALVLLDWHTALCFLGFLCSTPLACCARAGRAVVAMMCDKTLLTPGSLLSKELLAELGGKQLIPASTIGFHEAGGCPGCQLTCVWGSRMSIVVECGRQRFPWLVIVDLHTSVLSGKWQMG